MNRFLSGARLCGALLVSLTLLFPASHAQAEGFATITARAEVEEKTAAFIKAHL